MQQKPEPEDSKPAKIRDLSLLTEAQKQQLRQDSQAALEKFRATLNAR
jgi:hypothetical protein